MTKCTSAIVLVNSQVWSYVGVPTALVAAFGRIRLKVYSYVKPRGGQWDLNSMEFVSRDTNPGTWNRDLDEKYPGRLHMADLVFVLPI